MNLEGFDIQEQLGRGGMATVYRARQISLDREVAIKVFEPGFEPTEEDRNQFQTEAKVAARLKHPGLVQIYDAIFSNETYCFVMELVNGYTVGAWNERKGKLTEPQVLDIADYVAAALDYAWTQHGIIHCDIKPDNLMVDADGTVKVLDLGLCKTAQTMLQLSGTTDQVYGTPQYLSPEQAIGQSDLDCRTDIYALGATMYHLATGQMLFPGADGSEAMDKQVRAKAPNPSTLNPDLSPAFCSLIEKMLCKDRTGRQPNWKDVRSDIATARLGQPLASGNPIPGTSTVESAPPPSTPSSEKSHGTRNAAKGAARVRVATPHRRRAVVPTLPAGAGTAGTAAASPTAASMVPRPHAPLGMWIGVGALIGAVIIAGVWADGNKKKAAYEAQRDAEWGRAVNAVQALTEASDPTAVDEALAQYGALSEKYPELKEQAAAAMHELKEHRAAAEEARQKARFEALCRDAERLVSEGDFKGASALFHEDSVGASSQFASERKRILDDIQEAKRKKHAEDRLAEEQAQRQREDAEAQARLSEQARATEARILEAFEAKGIGFATSLMQGIEASHPILFEKSASCAQLRDLLRGIITAQERFDSAFKLGTTMRLELRNRTSFTGRLIRVDRAKDELLFTVTANGIDYTQTVLFRELAPKEILVRLGSGQDPGTRYTRVRLFRRYDLPLPTPTYLEDQCHGFPDPIRKAALK